MLRFSLLLAPAVVLAACANVDPSSSSSEPDALALESEADRPPESALSTDPSAPAVAVSSVDVRWLAPTVSRHAHAIDQVAARHGVDPRLVAIVIELESRGEPDAVSPIGALGLMQVMPETAADIARRHGLAVPSDTTLKEIDTNLEFGTRLLAELIADFGDPSLDDESVHRVATAYNGGSGVLLGRRAASEETVRYAARVVQLWNARADEHRP